MKKLKQRLHTSNCSILGHNKIPAWVTLTGWLTMSCFSLSVNGSTVKAESTVTSNNIINAFPQLTLNGIAPYPNASSPEFWIGLYLQVPTKTESDLFPAPGSPSIGQSVKKALQFRFKKGAEKSDFRQWIMKTMAKYHPTEQMVFWIQPFLQLILSIDRDLSPEDSLTFIHVPNQQTQLFFNKEWLFSSNSEMHFDLLLQSVLGRAEQPNGVRKGLLSKGSVNKRIIKKYQGPHSSKAGSWQETKNKKLSPNTLYSKQRIAQQIPNTIEQATLDTTAQESQIATKNSLTGVGPRPVLMMEYLKGLPKQTLNFTPNTRAYVTSLGKDG